MIPHCQWDGCEALAEFKVRHWNIETKAVLAFRYLCIVHLREEFGPWLIGKKIPT